MSSTFTLDQAGLQHLLVADGGAVDSHISKLARRTSEEAKGRAPRGATGKLVANIRAERRGRGWIVIADVDYSLAVHQGTKPHVIKPKRASVLRFPVRGGSVVYATKVNHPGTRAQPFLTDALRSVV